MIMTKIRGKWGKDARAGGNPWEVGKDARAGGRARGAAPSAPRPTGKARAQSREDMTCLTRV